MYKKTLLLHVTNSLWPARGWKLLLGHSLLGLGTVWWLIGAGCLGQPWRRGAVLMRCSLSGLWGAGVGGGLMLSAMMVSKWDDKAWRPGSMFIEGDRALMWMASSMPRRTQSCSFERIVTSSFNCCLHHVKYIQNASATTVQLPFKFNGQSS